MSVSVREASPRDLVTVGRLLHDFNREFGEESPPPEVLGGRLEALVDGGDTAVLLAGDDASGVAVLRYRRAIWSEGLECYLAELYVVPERRGQGIGRALMTAAIEHARARGADRMEIGVDEPDTAARGLYESFGFTNRSGGALMFVYERDL
jgi:ribosomal protein S18 acetylase RimI-like enzyme